MVIPATALCCFAGNFLEEITHKVGLCHQQCPLHHLYHQPHCHHHLWCSQGEYLDSFGWPDGSLFQDWWHDLKRSLTLVAKTKSTELKSAVWLIQSTSVPPICWIPESMLLAILGSQGGDSYDGREGHFLNSWWCC